MEYAGPIRGGSAGINSASFWICPECSACVMESPPTDGWQRQQHTAWHDKNRKSPTLEDLQRAAGEHTQLWANEIRDPEPREETNIAHGERDDGSGACLCGRESYLACPYWPEGGVAGLTWSVTPSMPSTPTPPPQEPQA